jgi:hypothetical protein
MLRRLAAPLALGAVSLLLAGLLAEGVLRARPGLIARDVLLEFDRDLRARVAERRGLPLRQARRCLAPEERADGGPELCLIAPGAEVHLDLDPEDRALGALERLPHDERGFCNPPHAAGRSRADLVAIGDSFTWCTAVAPESTWPARLEAHTGAAAYDLGVPGVGLHEYVEVLARFGLELQPKLVAVGLYGGNDLRDAARFVAHHEDGGSRRERRGPFAALLRESYAANFALASLEVVGRRLLRPEVDFRFDVERRGLWMPMNRRRSDLDEVRTARALAEGRLDPALWEAPLARLGELAAAHDFAVLLAYLPTAHAAYAPAVRFADSAVGEAVAALDAAQRRALPALAGRHGLAYVDCTDSLRSRVQDAELAYFPGNLHPTPVGHELIAACLAPSVAARLGSAAGSRPLAAHADPP